MTEKRKLSQAQKDAMRKGREAAKAKREADAKAIAEQVERNRKAAQDLQAANAAPSITAKAEGPGRDMPEDPVPIERVLEEEAERFEEAEEAARVAEGGYADKLKDLQEYQAGVISLRTLLERDPAIKDVDAELARIKAEREADPAPRYPTPGDNSDSSDPFLVAMPEDDPIHNRDLKEKTKSWARSQLHDHEGNDQQVGWNRALHQLIAWVDNEA